MQIGLKIPVSVLARIVKLQRAQPMEENSLKPPTRQDVIQDLVHRGLDAAAALPKAGEKWLPANFHLYEEERRRLQFYMTWDILTAIESYRRSCPSGRPRLVPTRVQAVYDLLWNGLLRSEASI